MGPTAVGKSALALKLAIRLDAEIVGADSRQVYRGMDIGTAKPSAEDRSAVPHHLIDVVDPDDEYSLALFMGQACAAVRDIHSRSRLPIVVGGTGQYVWGLLEGWQVPAVSPDHGLRRQLEERAALHGAEALFEDLTRLAPQAAARIDPRNVRRVVRALEIEYTSRPDQPQEPRKIAPPYQTRVIGLTLERAALYGRIDDRIDAMIEAGWIDEVSELLDRGYGPELSALSSLGYSELIQYLRDELTLDEAVQRIKYRTHRFARHQYAWFSLRDERIRWFDGSDELDAAEAYAVQWLALPGAG